MQAILQYLNQFHCRFISVCAEPCRLRWLLIRRRQLAAAFWRRHLSVDICRRRLQPKLHVAAVYWLSINEKKDGRTNTMPLHTCSLPEARSVNNLQFFQFPAQICSDL